MLFILMPFIIWRFLDFIIAFISPRFIPYLGHFSYATDLLKSKLPQFIYSWANFDGMFMLRISQKGYQEFEQAFFPFYPLVIRSIYQLTRLDRILIGLFISNLSFLIGLVSFRLKICNHSVIPSLFLKVLRRRSGGNW